MLCTPLSEAELISRNTAVLGYIQAASGQSWLKSCQPGPGDVLGWWVAVWQLRAALHGLWGPREGMELTSRQEGSRTLVL